MQAFTPGIAVCGVRKPTETKGKSAIAGRKDKLMRERYTLVPVNPDITLINDHDDATCYLVTGTERAVLIDTALGDVNLKRLCAEITNLPVTVLNTHGHGDHVIGNVYFSQAYLHPDDFALHDQCFRWEPAVQAMEKYHVKPAELLPLAVGQTFDLGGGQTLETVALRGHTAGSVGFLDRKHRILFSGDGVIPHIWMQLPESTSIEVLRQTLLQLQAEHGADFDWLLTGHAKALEPAEMVDALLRGCDELLAGKRESDHEYHWFEGVCLQHPCDAGETRSIVFENRKL